MFIIEVIVTGWVVLECIILTGVFNVGLSCGSVGLHCLYMCT